MKNRGVKFFGWVASISLLSWFVACSGTKIRMTEWKNDEMTVCCPGKCGDSEWQGAAAKYCTGQTTMIGGESRARLAGYESKAEGDGKVQFNPKVRQEACRIFQCNGNIIPPPSE
jgi:hypothetical protein